MSREIIEIPIVRKASTPDGAGGYTQAEIPITGSPFQGRIFRRAELSSGGFVADTFGETNKDTGVILSLCNPQAGVNIDDFALLPDGSRVRIVRIRRYKRSAQCDTELGID